MHARMGKREGKAPERNALRSRGCPNPDRALVRRRATAPRSRAVKPAPAAPLGMRVENVRREWQAAVDRTRALKASGQPWADSASKARALRAQLVTLDPSLALDHVSVSVDQGSAVNPVKAT